MRSILVCRRDALRLVNVDRLFVHYSSLGPQAHVFRYFYAQYAHVRRKNITIREDQAVWVEENHLNLSSFVRGKLDELIEERS